MIDPMILLAVFLVSFFLGGCSVLLYLRVMDEHDRQLQARSRSHTGPIPGGHWW